MEKLEWLAQNRRPRRSEIQPGWGLLFLVAAVLVSQSGPTLGLTATVLMFVVGLAKAPAYRLTLAVLTAALPYAAGAYVGARLGIRFYPMPPLNGYWVTSREQLTGLLLAAAFAILTGVGIAFQRAFMRSLEVLRERPGRGGYRLLRVAALLIAAHDAAVVLPNLGSLFAGGRHAYSADFVAGSGPLGIIITLSVSMMMVSDALVAKHAPKASAFALALMWLPSVAAGDRNYFSVAVIGWAAVYFSTSRNRPRKRLLAVAIGAAIVGFTLLPTLWSTNKMIGLNEWILPNSIFLPMALGVFGRDSLPVTPLSDQWQLLLPSSLRSEPITVLSNVFADLQVTGVSVGGNPWADLFLEDQTARIILFAALTTAIFLLGAALSKVSRIAPLLTFAVMMFWGRNLFWGTVVLVVWSALATAPFFIFRWSSPPRQRTAVNKDPYARLKAQRAAASELSH